MAPLCLGALLLSCLAVAVLTDLRERRIPNRLTLPAFVLALVIRGSFEGWAGPWGLQSGLFGAAIAFAPFFLLAWAGGMGMGDVKLAAVVGACVGQERILPVLFCIALAGGLQGVGALLRAGPVGRALRRALLAWRGCAGPGADPVAGRVSVPYGVAIALGTAWAMMWRPWLGP